MTEETAIVVLSHLRWDFVYQRPQHLLSRLAESRRVIFIEEPIHAPGQSPHWELSRPLPNLLVARLHSPLPEEGFDDVHLKEYQDNLPGLLAEAGVERPIAWLYTPAALPIARHIDPQLVVYDCMDDLASFLNAPPSLRAREAELLGWADLVFTGGRSMYEARRDRHSNIHCFPSSVDAAHFGAAREGAGLAEAEDQAGLPRPRLGFFGVIDERLDRELLAAIAAAHPEWQIVIVGPVVKIDRAELPQAPNIHYMGQRPYAELPSYLVGWDVCLLPFAINDATRFISPTKTLEYMAAERPIVSTPIADVAGPYGDIVYIGEAPEAFIAACERALAASDDERAERARKMRAVVTQTSWERTASAMGRLIDELLVSAG